MLQGTGVALITPFSSSGEIDQKAIIEIVTRCIDNNCDYLVVMGTTAEYPTLTSQERAKAIEIIKHTNKGRLPMVLGIGGNNTSEVLNEIKNTSLDDFYAILSVVP
ncbi:MAG: dihydrodipicolinate synthase family protein, partial [Flavobacteriales bacterium]|nr:dihydrodipicolinate synthase family protein [Flavobacteriales bacterium]